MAPIKILVLLTLPLLSFGQMKDSSAVNQKRLNTFVITSSVTYAGTLAGLNQLWYNESEKQSFKFFNDNKEWMQVDKLGHFYSAFYFSYGTSKALKWCHIPSRKADLIGAVTGFAILLPIEIFDGFSNDYGASTGDIIADLAGSSFYLLQSRLWNEVRIYPKFSFHRTDYASIRPSTLGNGLPAEVLKDYNGQTYWVSVDMDKFIAFPKWINVAAGYGAEGMIYARSSEHLNNGYSPAYRQVYISLDFDLTSFRSKSKFLNTVIFFANMIKIPAPTLAASSRGIKFHAFYF